MKAGGILSLQDLRDGIELNHQHIAKQHRLIRDLRSIGEPAMIALAESTLQVMLDHLVTQQDVLARREREVR